MNQNARNVLRSFAEHGMLAEFWTTLAWNPNSRWNRLLPRSLKMQLARRSISEAPAALVRSDPWREVVRLAGGRNAFSGLAQFGERAFSVVAMSIHFDARVARRVRELRPNIVYAYDGAALETFREAKRLGLRPCYELSSAFWCWDHAALFSEDARRNPAFASVHPKLKDSPAHLQRLDGESPLPILLLFPASTFSARWPGPCRKRRSG